jgi:hypothetical protein
MRGPPTTPPSPSTPSAPSCRSSGCSRAKRRMLRWVPGLRLAAVAAVPAGRRLPAGSSRGLRSRPAAALAGGSRPALRARRPTAARRPHTALPPRPCLTSSPPACAVHAGRAQQPHPPGWAAQGAQRPQQPRQHLLHEQRAAGAGGHTPRPAHLLAASHQHTPLPPPPPPPTSATATHQHAPTHHHTRRRRAGAVPRASAAQLLPGRGPLARHLPEAAGGPAVPQLRDGAHLWLQAACCPLPAACSACCLLPAACCLLPALRCPLPAACCLLPAACCLLPAACCLPAVLHEQACTLALWSSSSRARRALGKRRLLGGGATAARQPGFACLSPAHLSLPALILAGQRLQRGLLWRQAALQPCGLPLLLVALRRQPGGWAAAPAGAGWLLQPAGQRRWRLPAACPAPRAASRPRAGRRRGGSETPPALTAPQATSSRTRTSSTSPSSRPWATP